MSGRKDLYLNEEDINETRLSKGTSDQIRKFTDELIARGGQLDSSREARQAAHNKIFSLRELNQRRKISPVNKALNESING